MKLFKIILGLTALAGTVFPMNAVTDQEMEQARTITAQAYLRYANDGSGYLDDVKATSMAQLESKLKATEKENIKAFKSVSVPSDYATWDKAQLVEFWSVKFFESPALSAKGKIARSRVRRRIESMSVSAPAAATAKMENQTAQKTEDVKKETAPAKAEIPMDTAMPEAMVEDEVNILADQEAIEADRQQMTEEFKPEESHTWVYVLILVILVGVVIALVVFASNVIKKNNVSTLNTSGKIPAGNDRRNHDSPVNSGENRVAVAEAEEKIREKYAKTIAAKNEELKTAHNRIRILEANLDALKAENFRLKGETESRRTQKAEVKPVEKAPQGLRPTESAPEKKQEILKVIYLGRVNSRGLFIRADRRISLGNTIYRLDTNDGLVGTFRIAEDPTVDEMIIMDPSEMLSGGCDVDFTDSDTATSIVTDSPGTAIFENGCWKVLRKANVHFE